MRTRHRLVASWSLLLALAGLLAVATPEAAEAGRAKRLRFAATAPLATGDAGIATGEIALQSRLSARGREAARVVVTASSLNATRDANGNLPRYGVFVAPAVGDEVFLGALRVNRRGRGRLVVRRPVDVLSAANGSVRTFPGGMVEVRDGTVVLLRGALGALSLQGRTATADRRRVYGRFVPFSAPESAPGSYVFRTDETSEGGIRNRLVVRAPGLITGPQPPTYSVRVVNAASNRFVTLGNMDREPNLGASFRIDTRRQALAGGIVRWSEFDGGRIEVLRGGTLMLRGHIATMAGVAGDVSDVGLARARASQPLTGTFASGAAQAILTATAHVGPRRSREEVRLLALDLDPALGPFTLVTIQDTGTRRTLGTFRTTGAAGTGRLRISTRRGGSIPGGGAVRLAGHAVEVVGSGGTVVLTGSFPVLDAD